MNMHSPSHPGEILQEYMGNMTVSALAKHLDVTRPSLSMILNGRGGISAAMSLKLSEAFGTTPEIWLRLQNQYDLAVAKKKKRFRIRLIDVVAAQTIHSHGAKKHYESASEAAEGAKLGWNRERDAAEAK